MSALTGGLLLALGLAFFWSAVRKRGPFDFIVALILGLILLGIV